MNSLDKPDYYPKSPFSESNTQVPGIVLKVMTWQDGFIYFTARQPSGSDSFGSGKAQATGHSGLGVAALSNGLLFSVTAPPLVL